MELNSHARPLFILSPSPWHSTPSIQCNTTTTGHQPINISRSALDATYKNNYSNGDVGRSGSRRSTGNVGSRSWNTNGMYTSTTCVHRRRATYLYAAPPASHSSSSTPDFGNDGGSDDSSSSSYSEPGSKDAESNDEFNSKMPMDQLAKNMGATFADMKINPSDFVLLHELISTGNSSDSGNSADTDTNEDTDKEMKSNELRSDIAKILGNDGFASAFSSSGNTSKEIFAYMRTLSDLQAQQHQRIYKYAKRIRQQTMMNLAPESSIMLISQEQAQWLQLMVHATQATRVLEIGTFTGYSTLFIADALEKANRNGRMVTVDLEPRTQQMARQNIKEAGLDRIVSFVLQDGKQFLREWDTDGKEPFDMVFIDADKDSYPEYYELAMQVTRSNGVIVLDDALWSGRVAILANRDPETLGIRKANEMASKDPQVMSSMIPICDGMLIAVKLSSLQYQDKSKEIVAERNETKPLVSSWLNLCVAVEGIIGVGKSTLVHSLKDVIRGDASANQVHCQAFIESPNTMFLQQFYDKPQMFGFAFQMYMLQKTLALGREAYAYVCQDASNLAIIDRSVWGNQLFAKTNMMLGNIAPVEYDIYNALVLEDMSRTVDIENGYGKANHNRSRYLHHIDWYVYLDASPKKCYERISQRGNVAEKDISLEYLEALDTTHVENVIRDLVEYTRLRMDNKGHQDNTLRAYPYQPFPHPCKVVVFDWNQFQSTAAVLKTMEQLCLGKRELSKVVIKYDTQGSELDTFKNSDLVMLAGLIENGTDIMRVLEIPEGLPISLQKPLDDPLLYGHFKRVFMYLVSRFVDVVICTEEKDKEPWQ